MDVDPTVPVVKNLLLLDSDGRRVAVKYYAPEWSAAYLLNHSTLLTICKPSNWLQMENCASSIIVITILFNWPVKIGLTIAFLSEPEGWNSSNHALMINLGTNVGRSLVEAQFVKQDEEVAGVEKLVLLQPHWELQI